jgi:hypothetical protein
MHAPKPRPLSVPDYIDEAAHSEPNAVWAVLPRSSVDCTSGWHRSTFMDLAKAVDDFAWWLQKKVGLPKHGGQTIGYIGLVVVILCLV